ncbi:MAG: flavodoxin family protein [Lachnospiraceae bacterium]|nr:flavodoxin family protein [Lachnospiraceae bacterium]
MKCCVLMGSPRKNGNTITLVTPFMDELRKNGVDCELIWLYDKNIKPCICCLNCQKDWNSFNCPQKDDVEEIFLKFKDSDLAILATPIYSWYCTSPMKALLDRFVYGMNKFYSGKAGPALCAGKKIAIITTCGYKPERGADLFEEGIKRYSNHSGLEYLGMLCERNMGYNVPFESEDKKERARAFARELYTKLK